jgi:hypothetical protein
MADADQTAQRGVGIDLHWLPLAASRPLVRLGGFAFEAVAAHLVSRPRLTLYHSALEVRVSDARYVIELAPFIWGAEARSRDGVVGQGPVASRLAARLPLFRYDLRCWRGALIVDPERPAAHRAEISRDAATARRLLELVRLVPMHTWGRDEVGHGEVWTSNSVIAWLIVQAGAWSADLQPPAGGRAPGWEAGLHAAARHAARPAQPAVGPRRDVGRSVSAGGLAGRPQRPAADPVEVGADERRDAAVGV